MTDGFHNNKIPPITGTQFCIATIYVADDQISWYIDTGSDSLSTRPLLTDLRPFHIDHHFMRINLAVNGVPESPSRFEAVSRQVSYRIKLDSVSKKKSLQYSAKEPFAPKSLVRRLLSQANAVTWFRRITTGKRFGTYLLRLEARSSLTRSTALYTHADGWPVRPTPVFHRQYDIDNV